MLQLKTLKVSVLKSSLLAIAVLAASAPVKNFAHASKEKPLAPSVALDSPGAEEFMAEEVASWSRPLDSKRLSMRRQQAVSGGFVLRGTPSAAQRFNRGKLIPCTTKQAGTSFAASRSSCDMNNPVFIPLSLPGQERITNVNPGTYMLGFENSVYPGFIYVNPGRATVIDLQQIPVPSGGQVKIFRDLTSNLEQSKLFFSTYTLGESLFTLAAWDFGDLYVKPFGVEDGARQISYKFCEAAKLPEMTVKGSRICRAWNQGSYMSIMEMFDFEPLMAKNKAGQYVILQNTIGAYRQFEVQRPGRPFGYRMGRLLVSKETNSSQAAFVNVLPGKYLVEVRDSGGSLKLNSTGNVGPLDTYGQVQTNMGWLPSPLALKLEGKAVSAAPPVSTTLADGTVIADTGMSPEDDDGEFVNPNETCASSKMWRTEKRAYCHSDKTEGCDRRMSQLCEPTFDIP